MNGSLAQIIALTAYGNDFLRNHRLQTDFFSTNTTFQFCNKVDFIGFKKQLRIIKPSHFIIADNPLEWFKYLENGGCKKLRLYYEHSENQSFEKDCKLAGFVGGGGTWLIEAIYDNHSNYWANKWEANNQNDYTRKVRAVSYGMVAEDQLTSDFQVDGKEIYEDFDSILSSISNFAYNQNLGFWGDKFKSAISVLRSENPCKDFYHKDLIPLENYSLIAKQILFCAGTSWVFGGMGSWNDLGFENNETNELYDNLSGQLYSTIIEAIISAINSY